MGAVAREEKGLLRLDYPQGEQWALKASPLAMEAIH
jgi:hypothetical protein